jgi:SdrD B-like domain
MSQEDRRNALQEQAHSLMQGPLKHIRAAALAAALVPLASVVAAPAEAQTGCGNSGGICGFVFNDTNGNGIQDAGEPAIQNASLTLVMPVGSDPATLVTATNADGFYYFPVSPGSTYQVLVAIPPMPGLVTSPTLANQGADDLVDSDGEADGAPAGYVGTMVNLEFFEDTSVDFGFTFTPTQAAGTGTPGYWKNHPEAWPAFPAQGLLIGNVYYTKTQALNALIDRSSKDKTVTMFSSLLPAILNIMVGNDGSCVVETIKDARAWMALHPLGSNAYASSPAWKAGEPLHRTLDNYNNGGLCAPHRD